MFGGVEARGGGAHIEHGPALTTLRPDHLLLCIVSTVGFAVDIGEIQIASALGAIFSAPDRPEQVGTSALSVLLASTYAGAAIGALGFGLLARRLSASLTLALCMTLLACASAGAALSPGFVSLTAMRGLSGLAIGAYPPLAIAALTTHLPAKWRGPLILGVSAIGSLGGPAVVFATRQLTQFPIGGVEGWRIVLLGCGLAALVVSAGFVALCRLDRVAARPAPGFLPPRRHEQHAEDRLTHRLVLPALYILVNWAGVGFPLLSGVILLAKGFNLSDALLFVTAMTFGPLVGTLLSGLVVDRISRRTAIFWTLSIGAVALFAFGVGNNAWIVGVSSVLFGMMLGLNVVLLSLYSAEFYPSERRAESITRLWAMNRVSVAIAPLFLLPFLRSAGAMPLMLFLAAILAACAVLVRLAPAGQAGRELA